MFPIVEAQLLAPEVKRFTIEGPASPGSGRPVSSSSYGCTPTASGSR